MMPNPAQSGSGEFSALSQVSISSSALAIPTRFLPCALAANKGLDMAQLVYLPVVGRQDWVAVLDQQAQIQGFLKGDGF